MSDKDITQTKYAATVHITSSNLIRMRSAEDNNVSLESICELIHRYHISPIWLLTGRGDMYANTNEIATSGIIKSRIPKMERAAEEIRQSLKTLKKLVQ